MRILFVFCLVASWVAGASLPTAAPEQAGFSRDRLNRINTVIEEHIATGRLNGASGLIARNGKVVFRETWGAYKPDTIVRMYSMTKAITGVAAMILYEEGTVPADHPITVRDLFRHTTGLDYAGPKDENGEPAYKKLGVEGGNGWVSFDLAEAVRRLATAPLNHQPGTTFHYGFSIDVLGRLVEVLSGKPLDQFFEERIFRPLGMKDTAFFVPEEKWNRLAVLYTPKKGGGIEPYTGGAQENYKKKPTLLLGGAGSVSTLDDYARFVTMLLNDGELEGVRILGRKSVELMRSDHLGTLARTGGMPGEGYGFGLTFAVNLGPGKSANVGSEGEYNWGGAAGTSFWIDPKEHMVGVFLVNVLPSNDVVAAGQFKRLAYEALVD
ncbi:MAG: serine hydrolase domain-containing protein [Bryobacteraceae bacterium]